MQDSTGAARPEEKPQVQVNINSYFCGIQTNRYMQIYYY